MKGIIELDITPVPKPRQTRADRWKQRPAVMRYRAYADELRLRLPADFDFNHCGVQFIMPMPKSWSKKKKLAMVGQPCTQKPDLDNLLKALFDPFGEDSAIHSLAMLNKTWGTTGKIKIYNGKKEVLL